MENLPIILFFVSLISGAILVFTESIVFDVIKSHWTIIPTLSIFKDIEDGLIGIEIDFLCFMVTFQRKIK